MFDYLVIGKGLFGASATRYLSQITANVALIGPDEPADPATHLGVFGAHYDEGRIARRLSRDRVQAMLSEQALAQFATLESESGCRFYRPSGGIYVAQPGLDDGYFQAAQEIGREFKIDYELLNPQARQTTFPYLRFPPAVQMIWEKPPAGYINPRGFIRAQLTLAQRQGATVVREIAVEVANKGNYVEVLTQAGERYRAGKVLIATGAFSNGFNLFRPKLALKLKTEFVVMAEAPTTEVARLQPMPTVTYQIESPTLSGIYLLPPIRYPDGKYYVKMGANTVQDKPLQSLEETCHWYRSGQSDLMLPDMRRTLANIIPNLKAVSWHTARCVVTYTIHGQPYIDVIEPGRIYCAIGGNGRSAKSADAIGKLAAGLVSHERWQDDLDPALFKVHFL